MTHNETMKWLLDNDVKMSFEPVKGEDRIVGVLRYGEFYCAFNLDDHPVMVELIIPAVESLIEAAANA